MLITKFNKLIRNKFVWGAFAVLLSVALLGFMTSGSLSGGGKGERPSMGTLFGEPVTREEFARARWFTLGFQGRPGTTEEEREVLRRETWRRIAVLRAAGKMGVTASDREIAETVHRDQSFQNNGAFDPVRYNAIIERQLGVRVPTFENYLREELTMRKMVSLIGTTLWIPPSEVEDSITRLTDMFTVQTTMVKRDDLIDPVAVTDDDAKAFYETNSPLFEIPDQLVVRYVSWPISNYLAAVKVSDDEVMDYYDSHLEEYATVDTNELTTYVPLDDVEEEIKTNLIHKAAVLKAESDATEFAVALAPSRYGDAETMEAVAAKCGLAVSTTKPFSAWGSVPGIEDVDIAFNRAAFALDATDPDAYFSYAVTGKDNVYILATHTNIPAHVPEFGEVEEKARDLAQLEADNELFSEKMEQIRTTLLDSMENGTSFEDAAAGSTLGIVDMDPFSVFSASSEEMDDFDVIVPGVLSLDAGQLSEALSTADGALLAYVKTREPADFTTTEDLKPDVLRTLHGTRARILFNDWADKLVARGRTDNEDSEQEEEL